MKKIAEGNSPHVVNMVGCVTIQEPIMLLTAFVKHGDLLHYLEYIRKHVSPMNHYQVSMYIYCFYSKAYRIIQSVSRIYTSDTRY